jgi:dCTP deaminase
MIWNDKRIFNWASAGGVTPFDESCVNPASLDLRLGNSILVPRRGWELKPGKAINRSTSTRDLWQDAFEFDVYRLEPGCACLCHSDEYIRMPSDAAGTLFSKSSTGRILLEHLHAGYFDPDFHGQATFEFFNDGPWPIEIRPGERLVQLRLEQMIAPPMRSYLKTGHYNGQMGATPAIALEE